MSILIAGMFTGTMGCDDWYWNSQKYDDFREYFDTVEGPDGKLNVKTSIACASPINAISCGSGDASPLVSVEKLSLLRVVELTKIQPASENDEDKGNYQSGYFIQTYCAEWNENLESDDATFAPNAPKLLCQKLGYRVGEIGKAIVDCYDRSILDDTQKALCDAYAQDSPEVFISAFNYRACPKGYNYNKNYLKISTDPKDAFTHVCVQEICSTPDAPTGFMNDNLNCGACAYICGNALTCQEGICKPADNTKVNCNGNWIDPQSDVNHCGASLGGTCDEDDEDGANYRGSDCTQNPTTKLCVQGKCAESCPNGSDICQTTCLDMTATHVENCDSENLNCKIGYANCDDTISNGCETHIENDNKNCGSCGNACENGFICSNGECSLTCRAGTENCNGTCLNLEANNLASCTPTTMTCQAHYLNCDDKDANGCETDSNNDINNCGGCGKDNDAFVCKDGHKCFEGNCVASCSGATRECGDICLDFTANHVESCNNSKLECQTGYLDCDGNLANGCEIEISSAHVESCSGTSLQCQTNYANCDGNVANGCEIKTDTDSNNCGGCGIICKDGKKCSSGVCVASCSGATQECGDICLDFTANHVESCNNSKLKCQTGYLDCDGNLANGCEIEVVSAHVESCSGTTLQCQTNYANCDGNVANGCETKTDTDSNNCGGCRKDNDAFVCKDGNKCSDGKCVASCSGTTRECGEICLDFTANHVKSCDNSKLTCQTGYLDCDGNLANGCEIEMASAHVESCSGITLQCQTNYANCDGNVANGCETKTDTDNNNCGGCGKTNNAFVCNDGNKCSDGKCVASCSGATRECGDICLDFTANHVESCDNSEITCQPGYLNCDGNAANGCEIETLSMHVASCTETTLQCQNDYANCDKRVENGCEVNLTNDIYNCGGCSSNDVSYRCEDGKKCSAGECVASCSKGTTECGNICLDFEVNHVKSCSDSTLTCQDGYLDCDGKLTNGCELDKNATHVVSCSETTLECAPHYIDYDKVKTNGCEVNTLTDRNHCGSENHPCSGDEVCIDGTCTLNTCGTGLTLCMSDAKRQCIDITTNPQNCGYCGYQCQTTIAHGSFDGCTLGKCTYTCDDGFSLVGETCVANCTTCTYEGSCLPLSVAESLHYKTGDGKPCTCIEGYDTCDGSKTCIPLNTKQHCGSCSNTCQQEEICSLDGTPKCQCDEANGYVLQGTQCVSINSDAHCGSLAKQCEEGTSCGQTDDGTYDCLCDESKGFDMCDGSCVSLSTPNHCGTCENSCGNGQLCTLDSKTSSYACTCPDNQYFCAPTDTETAKCMTEQELIDENLIHYQDAGTDKCRQCAETEASNGTECIANP